MTEVRTIQFFKEPSVPVTLQPDSLYFIKENGASTVTLYLTNGDSTIEAHGIMEGPAGPAGETAYPNLLINGDFQINERNATTGAIADGDYFFDRWKAGSGGCNVTLSGFRLTHNSGPIEQVIENPNLAGKTVFVSVGDLTGGALDIDIDGATGTILSGSGRVGVAITVPSGSTGNVTVTLTPNSSAVTYERVKLEDNSQGSVWVPRPDAIELLLCQRYYERLDGTTAERYLRRGNGGSGRIYYPIAFLIEKRAIPAISLINVTATNTNTPQINNISRYQFEFSHQLTAGTGFSFFGFEADAEL